MSKPAARPPLSTKIRPTPLSAGAPRAPEAPTDGRASGASRRLRALAALSGSLTDALRPEDAASLVEQKALSALGATSAAVVTLGPFPPPVSDPAKPADHPPATTLNVVHAIGLPAELKAALDQLPLDAPVPFAEVARTGEPLFLATESDLTRYPEWGTAMVRAGAGAAAIVPVWANGELRGVLGLAWADARPFDEDERAFVLTLGVMCAQAIMRAHLRAAELEAREQAEAANRSKARFVATISHELRTPISAVLGYTELLAEEISGPISAIQKEHLGRVRASGTHLMGLIEDLLGYARVEAGEEHIYREPVLLPEVVERSVGMVLPLAEKKGLHIRVESSSDPVMMFTDIRKLSQILVNLLANAVKFTDAGEISLATQVLSVNGLTWIHFEITDTGRGISPADQDRIFEPFWQAQSTETNGTGLGLSVARQLARLLGGDLKVVRSALASGSTFLLALPARS